MPQKQNDKGLRAEFEKMKKMDSHKRRDYIRTYYLVPAIVVVICFLMAIFYIKDTLFQPKFVCCGVAYEVELTDAQKEFLTNGYIKSAGLNPRKFKAALATDNMFEGTEQKMDAYTHEMALFAQIAAGQIQYLILDEHMMKMFEDGGIYSGLQEVLSEETMNMLDGMTIDLHDSESGSDYPAAVDLSKLGFIEHAPGGAYLLFAGVQEDEHFPEAFMNYILTERKIA